MMDTHILLAMTRVNNIPYVDIRPGSQADLFLRRFVQNKLAIVGFVITSFYLTVSFVGPLLIPHDPHTVGLGPALQPPSSEHWLGTDQLGRDVFSRVIVGGRISILVGVSVVALGSVVGVTLGLIAGFFRGMVDNGIMRWVDVMFAFPNVLLAIVIVAILGEGLAQVILALGIAYGVYMTRVVRGSAISVREEEFIMAAISYAERAHQIMFREMLPNVMSAVIVQATLIWAFAILAEATLSYLGLSAQPPTVTWGVMVSGGQDVVVVAPWTVIAPGFAIMISVLGLTFLGVGLRDALDPYGEVDDSTGGGI